MADEDVDLEPDKFGGEIAETVGSALREPLLYEEGSALLVPEVTQRFPKRSTGIDGSGRGTDRQPSNPVHPLRLLRLGRERRHENNEGQRENSEG